LDAHPVATPAASESSRSTYKIAAVKAHYLAKDAVTNHQRNEELLTSPTFSV